MRLGIFAWGVSLGKLELGNFRLGTFGWLFSAENMLLWSFRLECSHECYRVVQSASELSLVDFRLESDPLKLSLEILRFGTLAWGPSTGKLCGIFSSGTFVWQLSLEAFASDTLNGICRSGMRVPELGFVTKKHAVFYFQRKQLLRSRKPLCLIE